MNEINIELFPASYGESILVSCKGNKPTNIMIDMGFVSTYNNSIKNRLQVLRDNNECINLLVFTHLDADHISGGISFLKENGNSLKANIINIDEIWFNSIKHLKIDTKNIHLNDREKNILKSICSKRYPKELYVSSSNDISCEQGLTLGKLIKEYEYKCNENSIIRSESGKLKEIIINNEVKIIILSPTQRKLDDLIDIWKEQLLAIGIKNIVKESDEYDDAFELLLVNSNQVTRKSELKDCALSIKDIEELASEENFTEDKDRINGSSISFILEFNEKKVLFLADSHPSIIENGLNWYRNNTDKKIYFDAVKISHHGSDNNTSVKLINMIKCEKFIISTNGFKFDHPGSKTIARIISSNPEVHKKIISNYNTKSMKSYINNKFLKEKYNYEIFCTNDINVSNKKCNITNIDI